MTLVTDSYITEDEVARFSDESEVMWGEATTLEKYAARAMAEVLVDQYISRKRSEKDD